MVKNKRNICGIKINDDWTRRPVDHTKFGGYIYQSDFDTETKKHNNYDGSQFVKRLISNWNFDSCCENNAIELRRKRALKLGLISDIRKGDAIF